MLGFVRPQFKAPFLQFLIAGTFVIISESELYVDANGDELIKKGSLSLKKWALSQAEEC